MKKYFFKISLFVSVALLLVLLFVFSPFFNIKTLSITGVELLDINIVENNLDLRDENIFLVSEQKVKETLETNPYIKSAALEKEYPDILKISIVERKPAGYVKYNNDTFLLIDQEGYVLETTTEMTEDLPLTTGLKFNTFVLGQPLAIDGNDAFFVIVTLTNLINKYEINGSSVKIDLHDLDNIKFSVHNVEFLFGKFNSDADYKVQMAKQTFDKLHDNTVIKAIVNLETGIVERLT